MQYGPLGGAVRVVIASDAPQAVAELDKLASYADQVSLVGFIRHPQELDEDLEALLPDLVLLYTGFGGVRHRRPGRLPGVAIGPASGSWWSSTPTTSSSSPAWRTPAPRPWRTDADPATLVAAIRGAVALPAPPEDAEPAPSWPGLAPRVLWPEEPAAEYGGPALPEPFPPAEYGGPSLAGQLPPDEYAGPSLAEQSPAAGPSPAPEPAPEPFAAPEPFPAPEPLPVPQPFPAPEGPVAAPPPTLSHRDPLGGGAGPRGAGHPLVGAGLPAGHHGVRGPRTSAAPGRWPGVSTASPAIPAAPAPPMAAEPEAEPVAAARPRPPRRRPGGNAELVVVFSGKGGVGKSLIATNLAVALAAERRAGGPGRPRPPVR